MSEWKEYKLSDIATIHNKKRIPLNSRQRLEIQGKYPYYGASGIVDYVNDYLFDGQYVLISEDGENLRSRQTTIAFIAEGKFWVNNHAHILQGNDYLVNEFIFYYFQQLNINPFITGAVQPKLNLQNLLSIPIFMPEREERIRVTKLIHSLTRKIENLRKQNETLEKIAQTLFKHWFIDFEFPNENGQPYRSSGGAMQPSELGAIPAGWRVGKLGDVVEINAKSINKDYKHKNIEYVDISSVGVGTLESTTPYILKDSPSRARRLVSHGDVIWSGVRPNRKSYLYISHPVSNLVVSTGFITLTPNLIPASYLYGWVTTDTFVDYLTFNASGSAYPAVKPEHFEIAEILLPDETTLNNFHALVDTVREKIFYNSKQIQTLTKTRDTLLPELMSGKLRIPE
ncbi:restriction endonuclease subunit S [Planktothricoides raciborskii]|uniref:Restriction endonuclease subunit S n=1 Tax=Planktothricoides raciborskii GIHE-MW2 TaxID=2792601 RepID=A0AAU8JBJ4_9CYAN